MEQLLQEARFAFVSEQDKQFIAQWTDALSGLGYTYGGAIGSGFCWGRDMIVYTKANVKTKKVVARIYMREQEIVLRLFFSQVTKHADYLAGAPDFIKDVFTGPYGDCKHCKGDCCKFRKDYTLGGVAYEKCNGYTFEFYHPTLERLDAYLELFQEFYPARS